MRKSVKLKDIVEYAKGSQINGDNLIEEAEFPLFKWWYYHRFAENGMRIIVMQIQLL